jgi:hypothetical protein
LLSPVLSSISKQTPYSVPSGYFDNLEKGILQSIKQNTEIQTAKEELENISPLLGSLKKEMPYQVPEGYFQDLGPRLSDKTEKDKSTTKVVSITSRKWFRYAAAAMVTGIIAMTVLFISTKSNQPSETEILAKFTKEVKKLDDSQKDKLADFMDAGFDGTEMVKLNPDKPNEVKDLLKGISEEELKDFQEQNEDLKDVLLTTDYNE